jgi:integrase
VGYLYPSELLALLSCRSVPLARRVAVALAVYTGLRKGSLRALTWADVDFQHGTLAALVAKNDLPTMFQIPAGLVTILRGWHEHLGRPAPTDRIITDLECRQDREAEALRADLQAAGVTRAVLFSEARNVERLRFHDARATFVSWALRAGRGIGWITDRTGHLTEEMVQRYSRAARTLADLEYQAFPDIADAIPKFTELPDNVRRVDFKRGS